MALKTLDAIKTIAGFDVAEVDSLMARGSDFPEEHFIVVNHGDNTIHFMVQDGPIGEVGVNGCQVDSIIEAARLIVHGLNKKFPCRENSLVITKLEEALHWLAHRKANREARGVEGRNEV